MNSKLIEYLNKTRNGKKDNIRAILLLITKLIANTVFKLNCTHN